MTRSSASARLSNVIRINVVGTYAVTVVYGRSLDDMVQAGRYDSVHRGIALESFQGLGPGRGIVDIVVIHFNSHISSEDALMEMYKCGLRSATLPELLALGELYPTLQRKNSIIALGSVFDGGVVGAQVVWLHGWVRERTLSMLPIDCEWNPFYCFAAVCS